MPTAFQLVETSFPQPDNKNTEQKIDGIYDYLFILLEQLRYTLFNLDGSNVNQSALSDFIQNISDPIYAKIKDTDENVNELSITAQGLTGRISDAEGDITQLVATAQGLAAAVQDAEGKITVLTLTVDGLTVTDQSGTTRIKGSSIETESIAANSISADKLNLTGQIAFSDLDAATQSSIYNANSNASSAIDAVSAWRYSGSTYIDGSKIMTGTVMATKLLGGTVGLLAPDESVVGALNLAYTTTGIGLGILTSQGGIQIQSAGNVFLASGDGAFITLSNVVSLGGAPLVLSSKMYGNTPPSSPVQGTLYFLRKNT